jgi:pyruvate/2-oxoglutarate/acetoin dehydrogenase E1 component
MRRPRVAESLNQALHGLLAEDPQLYLLGEDIVDPYGGAFKITKGLSSRFPDRVLATPLSEGGMVGLAAGLALAGDRAIVEMMFADFVTLAYDQILNLASKSVSMYGRRLPMPLVIRCPTGGNRGYGPTHSQSLQKHFIGIPGLSVFEVSPFQDHRALFDRMLGLAEPCLLFEDKVLYTHPIQRAGPIDDIFFADPVDRDLTRVHSRSPGDPDCVLIAPGGLVPRALPALRELLLEDEIDCMLLVPTRLYPLDVAALAEAAGRARTICVVEDGTAGGTWGAEVAHQLHERIWARLRRPVTLVHGADSVIPTAAHLEREVLVQDTTIRQAVLEAVGG